ncbi:NAD(P)-binding protein [Penicillium angulare]|uniref:NAD(P)-binding protein n=1 Tax=Penicillium angulare TaxID=116970 RepID=A0A9W9EKH4_9EURO|nr:NAD(P)-binding protein [Penicillium angulare]
MAEYAEITSISMLTSFSEPEETTISSKTRYMSKVVVAGASGNLGPSIIDQLLKNGFDVTVLSRQSSSHIFPEGVKVRHVDYTSRDSLCSALAGKNAVVSALPTHALDCQTLLIEAAVAAGVQRFIPSEFGSDTTNPNCALLPLFQNKILAHEMLKEKATQCGLSYTIIYTGPFLDWGMKHGFMNIKGKFIDLYNNGDQIFSTTTLPSIGRAVCGVLMKPIETRNRVVRVHDIATTQKRILSMAKRVTGPYGWMVNKPSIEDMLSNSFTAYWQGMQDVDTTAGFIAAASWGRGYGGVFEQTDNELLGIPMMSEDVLRGLIHFLWEQ